MAIWPYSFRNTNRIMPIYVYKVIDNNIENPETFEVEQAITEEPITQHPLTGEPVQRVIQAASLNIEYTQGQTDKLTDPIYAESKGFTKYEKDQLTGRYHKLAGGEGPDTLDPSA